MRPTRARKTVAYADSNPDTVAHRCTCNKCAPTRYLRHPHQDPAARNATWIQARWMNKLSSTSRQAKVNTARDEFEGETDIEQVLETSGLSKRRPDVYEPLTLAKACAAHMRRALESLTAKQEATISRWQKLNTKFSSNAELPDEEDVRNAKVLLDILLFQHSLTSIDVHLAGLSEYSSFQGNDAKWTPKMHIYLDKDYCTRPGNRKHKASTPFLTVCGALLHEMCHAFLFTYTCAGAGGWGAYCNCRDGSACRRYANENFGKTGHGRAWHILVTAVEEVAPVLLGAKLKLWGKSDFEQALWDGWIPSTCDMETCFGAAARRVVQDALDEEEDRDERWANSTAWARRPGGDVDNWY